MGEGTYAISLPKKEKRSRPPIISRDTQKRRTTTVAVPGSLIAQTDRGRHSRPGVDEPYEPVVLHA